MRARRHMRGFGMVEFALLAPVAFLLLYAITELGRAGYDYSVVASSAREGARAAVAAQEASKSASQIQADVINAARNSLGGGVVLDTSQVYSLAQCTPPAGKARVCMSPSGSTKPGGGANPQVKVQVTYAFQPLVGLVSNVIGSSITLSSTTTMTTEY